MYPPLVGRARQYLTVWGLGAVLARLARFLDEPQLRAGLIKPPAFVRSKRLYTLRVTMKVFLTPCLSQDYSCRTAVATAKEQGWLPPGASPDTAAYCRARDALSAAGLSQAVVQTGEALDVCVSPDHLWLGRRVRVIKGTGIALPDTPANQADYPQPAEQKPGCGFPVLGLVALMSLATDVVVQYVLSSLHEPDNSLTHPSGSLDVGAALGGGGRQANVPPDQPAHFPLFTFPLHHHHHALDQLPNNRLAVCGGCRLGVPQGGQITRETTNGLAFATRV